MNEKHDGVAEPAYPRKWVITRAARELRAFEGRRARVTVDVRGASMTRTLFGVKVEDAEVLEGPRGPEDELVLRVGFEQDQALTPHGEPYSAALGLEVHQSDLQSTSHRPRGVARSG